MALAGVDCESGVTFTDGKAKVTWGGPSESGSLGRASSEEPFDLFGKRSCAQRM